MNEPKEATLGKRERTKVANRAAILAAARSAFAELGFESATVRDIVRRSGLSIGTFYNYFPDKETALAALLDDLLAELRPAVREPRHSATSIEGFVRDAFEATIRVLLATPENAQMLRSSGAAVRAYLFDGENFRGVFEELRHDLRMAVDIGLLPAFDVDLMTASMVGATLEVCVLAARADSDPGELASFLSQLFIGGMERFARGVSPT